MEGQPANGWALAAADARGQNGRITAAQLHARGVSNSSIDNGVRSGRLHRLHRGVFALGHLAPSRLGDWSAAVLACGTESVLSHRSAATLWRIREGQFPRIDVTNATGSGRGRAGIRVHRTRLLPVEMTTHCDVPVTSPARTMVDMAHELEDADDVQWLLRQLQYRRLYDLAALELSLARRPNRVLDELLSDLAPTRSPLEVPFLTKVVRRHGLPEPQCQERIQGFYVDFFWPQASLIVEVDGGNHILPAMRQADAVRDNRFQLAGYLVLRYMKRDIYRWHARTAAQIAAALAVRGQLSIHGTDN